jgi:hypothetical protein
VKNVLLQQSRPGALPKWPGGTANNNIFDPHDAPFGSEAE